MKRRRIPKDLQERVSVALPLLAKARELLEKAPEGSQRLTKVAANSSDKNVSAKKTRSEDKLLGETTSDKKHASEDDEGECSPKTNPNFDMDEDIRESLTRHSVKMCKISGKLFEAVARDVVRGRQRGEVTSIGPVKQLVCDAELAMGVEFRLLKADLDRYSDDPSRR